MPLLWVSRLIFHVFVLLLEITIGIKHFPVTLLPAELFLNFEQFSSQSNGSDCLVSSDCVVFHAGRLCTTALIFFTSLKKILVQSLINQRLTRPVCCFLNAL